jgi:hypothetical protein
LEAEKLLCPFRDILPGYYRGEMDSNGFYKVIISNIPFIYIL